MEMASLFAGLAWLRSQVVARPMVRDAITTTVLSTLGKAIGFLIPFFIAAWFGVTGETDAFFFGYSVIMLFVVIFAPVAESIIVPFIAEARAQGEDVGRFVSNVLGLSGIILLCVIAPFLVCIKPILAFLTKFSPEGLNLIHLILLESSPLIILLIWTSILTGALNAYKVFSIPALSPGFRAVVTLAFIFIFKQRLGVHAIALGYVLGELCRLCILFVVLIRRKIFQLRFSITWEKKISAFLKTSSYQIAGMFMVAFAPVINKVMASWLGLGQVSLLTYAERIYFIPDNLLCTGIIVTLLPYWSERYYSDSAKRLAKDVGKVVKPMVAVSILLTALFLLIKNYLVVIVYSHGKFSAEQITNVQHILGWYLIGLTPSFLLHVYARALLTRKETKVLLVTAFLGSIAAAIFNFMFMRMFGIVGIALANSCTAFFTLGVLVFYFYKGERHGVSAKMLSGIR